MLFPMNRSIAVMMASIIQTGTFSVQVIDRPQIGFSTLAIIHIWKTSVKKFEVHCNKSTIPIFPYQHYQSMASYQHYQSMTSLPSLGKHASMTGALCWKLSYTFQFLLSKQTAKTDDLKQTSRERPPSAKYYHMRTSTSNITEQAICPAVVN